MVAPVRLGETFAPLSERHFRLLWLGRASSAAGDALMPLAVAFAVLSVNGSATALGAVLASFWISRVAFTLVGGVVSDRLPRRAVMLACDGFRACIEAFTATMLLTHQMTLPIFIITAALFGTASAFFGPAADGLVPQTISAARLQPANALLGITNNAMNVFGPAIAGILIVVHRARLGLRRRFGQLPRERLVPDEAADPGARATAAQHVRARAA